MIIFVAFVVHFSLSSPSGPREQPYARRWRNRWSELWCVPGSSKERWSSEGRWSWKEHWTDRARTVGSNRGRNLHIVTWRCCVGWLQCGWQQSFPKIMSLTRTLQAFVRTSTQFVRTVPQKCFLRHRTMNHCFTRLCLRNSSDDLHSFPSTEAKRKYWWLCSVA